jgi:Recombination endonuclease VII
MAGGQLKDAGVSWGEADRCGKWMPRADTPCVRRRGHPGGCKSEQSMARFRDWKAEWRRRGGDDPAAKQRWSRTSRLRGYGLTRATFDQLLETQRHACGMCGEPFQESGRICIDHDHACCASEKKSCGQCIRGLLCLSCNTTLGHIERNQELARRYQTNPPGPFVRAAQAQANKAPAA